MIPRRWRFALCLLLPALLPGRGEAQQPFAQTETREPTSVIIRVRAGVAALGKGANIRPAQQAGQISQWCSAYGAHHAKPLWPHVAARMPAASDRTHPGLMTFTLDVAPGHDPETVARDLAALSWVEWAEPDRLYTLHDGPNDPFYPRQWSLENEGQPYWAVIGVSGVDNDTIAEATGTPDADVDYLSVYEYAGSTTEILVGVLDTGLDPEHEDLRDRLAANPGEIPDNGLDDDHNGFVDDVYGWDFSGDVIATANDLHPDNDVTDHIGHGTHVAGIIAATADNATGIAGVAPHARVFSAKMFPNPFFSVAAQAVYYAVDYGARVINMSWGGGFESRVLIDALEYAHSRGVVLIASTGNSGSELVFFPAGYTQTIAVGASHSRDGLARFSTYNNAIDVVAPGQQILSLRAAGTDLYEDIGEAGRYIVADKYLIASGTSMAAPHASGVAAALLSITPTLGNERVRTILRETAVDIRDPFDDGSDLPGWDKYTGAGRIDLANAIAVLPRIHAVITHPLRDAWVGGEITIRGSVTGEAFAGYTVAIAAGYDPAPEDWTAVASGNTAIEDGILATLSDLGRTGPYTIRLDAGPDAQFDVRVIFTPVATAEISAPGSDDTISVLGLITGTAAAPEFLDYTIAAVGPLPATTVYPITESTAPVWDDTLAVWSTTELEPGDYNLVLTVHTTDATLTDTMRTTVRNPFARGWPVQLESVAHFAVRTADIDGHGDEEIICPTTTGLYVYRSDGTVYPGWPRGDRQEYTATPAIADLDFDGKQEIIIATPESMQVLAFVGEAYEGWPQPFSGLRGEIFGGSVATVGNLDGHGDLEIAAIDRQGAIRVWHADGTTYQPEGGGKFGSVGINGSRRSGSPAVSICDLNRDGRSELIVAGDEFLIFDGLTAEPFGTNPLPQIAAHASTNGLAIADFDNDGHREIAYAYSDDLAGLTRLKVNILDADGQPIPGWPRVIPDSLFASLQYTMTAGDIDGDDVPEIFLAPYSLGSGTLYGFHGDGSPVGSDSTDGRLAQLPGSISAVGLVDLDNDQEPEIIARVGQILGGIDLIVAIEIDGRMLPGFPITFGVGSAPVPAMPVITDLDHDGLIDMVTLQSNDEVLTVWELDVPRSHGASPWQGFRGDLWNSSVAPSPRYNVVYLMRVINRIFRGIDLLPPYEPDDINCDGTSDITDVVRLIDYLYNGGTRPCVP